MPESQLSSADAADLLYAIDRLSVLLFAAEAERMSPTFHQIIESVHGTTLALGARILRLGGDSVAINAEYRKKEKNENPLSS